MDGLYPSSNCNNLQFSCNTGGTWISTAFIRNRGETSFATIEYDEGYPDYLTNNTPATIVYIRVAPSQYTPNKKSFWINGWERPRLVLTRNKKYQFNVVTCGEPFYLTTSSKGGLGNVENITAVSPSDYYVYTYTITPNVPGKFFYQSSKTDGLGGIVIVKN